MVLFFKIKYSASFEKSSLQRWNLKISVNGQAVLMYEAILCIAVAYIL